MRHLRFALLGVLALAAPLAEPAPRYALLSLLVVGVVMGGSVSIYGQATPELKVLVNNGGDDVEPRVTTDGGGNWVAVWASNDSLGGTIGGDRDIFVARSADNGATWTAPAALNTNAAVDVQFDDAPQVATDSYELTSPQS